MESSLLRRAGLVAVATGTTLIAAAAPAAAQQHGDRAGAVGAGHSSSGSSNSSAGHSGAGSGHGSTGHASGPGGPAGNNGTIKVHDVAGDHSMHNVPHVGCSFYLDFFGFDGGQTASISFVGQAPTGAGTPLLSETGVTINPASTRGTGSTWDSERHYTLDTGGLGAAQAQQGYHVKVMVDADGAPGGAKQKVFWIAPCTTSGGGSSGTSGSGTTSGTTSGSTSGSGGSTSGTTGGSTGGTTSGSTSGSGAGSSSGSGTSSTGTTASGVGGTTLAASASQTPRGTQVLGEHFTRANATGTDTATSPTAGTAVLGTHFTRGGSLPFTGAGDVGLLTASALAALGAGGGLVLAGRRRRTNAS